MLCSIHSKGRGVLGKISFQIQQRKSKEKQHTKKVYERCKNKIDNEYKNLEKVNIFKIVFIMKK